MHFKHFFRCAVSESLTQVVVDKVCGECRLLVLAPAVHAGIGVSHVHREDVCADAHKLRLPHQLADG